MEEADAEVRRFYETSDATGYDTKCLSFQIRNDPIEYTDRLLLYKLALVTRHYRGGPVLDLCCATGQCLLTLAPSIDSGIGLDFSRRFVEAASKRAADLGLRNLAFIQGSATAMPLKSELFGMIYCFSSLYAIPRVDIAIAEIARVLRPGGTAVLDFGNIRSLSAYCARFYTDWAKTYPITRSAMHQNLAANGLDIVERHCFQILPLWADRPRWVKPLLHPGWKKVMSLRVRDKMLDEWVSSLPGLRSFAFRHVLVCAKS